MAKGARTLVTDPLKDTKPLRVQGVTCAEEPTESPSAPAPCDLNTASAISKETTLAQRKQRPGGGRCAGLPSRATLHPSCLSGAKSTPRGPEGGGSAQENTCEFLAELPRWLHSTLSSFIKDSICSISDPRARTNRWRPGVAALLLAVFPAAMNHRTPA